MRKQLPVKYESQHQRRMRRQCAVLGGVALFFLVLLIFQKVSKSRFAYTEPARSKIVTADNPVQTKTEVPIESETSDTELLMLVNKDHAVPDGYEVEEHWLKNGRVSVSDLMYDALKDMLTDGSEDGREFVVASGYRSSEYQNQLLEEDILDSMEKYGMTWQEAYDKESQETMPAGHSEHETGLAVDLVAVSYQVLDAQQEYTAENQWLREHCHEYGFILRYPEGKGDITGINYEPWHFRYVGKEAAREIMERGITLEEYLGEV